MSYFEHLPDSARVVIAILGFLVSLYLFIAWLLLPVYVIRRLTQIRDLLSDIKEDARAVETKQTLKDYKERAGYKVPGLNG